jgi:hypothetical protein
MTRHGRCIPDDDDPDMQTLLFDYPTSFAPDTAAYIRRDGKNRNGRASGPLADLRRKPLTPYVAEQFPGEF